MPSRTDEQGHHRWGKKGVKEGIVLFWKRKGKGVEGQSVRPPAGRMPTRRKGRGGGEGGKRSPLSKKKKGAGRRACPREEQYRAPGLTREGKKKIGKRKKNQIGFRPGGWGRRE